VIREGLEMSQQEIINPAISKIIVYILKLNDGSFYVGITKNLEKRLSVHKRKRNDFELFHKEFYPDYRSARIREKYYKKRNRIRLIKEISGMAG
jgi:predicted GIY-YIG superfamily endonuclease